MEKRGPPTLLVGILVGTATMENGMEAHQRATNRATIGSSNPTSEHLSRQTSNSKT